MEGLSVTDAMANYSLSALRCAAGGACSVLSGRRISPHPPFALRSRNHRRVHNLEQLWEVYRALQ